MPSTYNYLGIEKMETGENAGTWGTKTNTNLDIIQQAASGYHSQSIAGGAQTTALLMTDGDATSTTDSLTNAARNQVIKLTGSITGNQIVTFPTDTEGLKIIFNGTTDGSGTPTVQLKGASDSGSGTTFAASDKGKKMVYMSGTDLIEVVLATAPAGSDTQLQYNNSGAFGGASGLTTDGTNLNILAQGDLRLQDTTGNQYVAHQAAGTTTTYTVTWPGAVATSNDQILTSTTGGVLSWVDNSGGTDWQTVITAATKTAVAGEGYFIDTTSNVCNVTLPAGTLGDEVSLVDYAGTFDSNTLTVTPASGERIQGESADAVLTNSTERSAFTLAYSGATQGWLLKNN
jgi:hypothetical protein